MFDNRYLVLHIQLSKTITKLGKIQDGSLEIQLVGVDGQRETDFRTLFSNSVNKPS